MASNFSLATFLVLATCTVDMHVCIAVAEVHSVCRFSDEEKAITAFVGFLMKRKQSKILQGNN